MMPTVLSHNAPDALLAVKAALETGGTIVFPTDTVYGLGGNPWDERTLSRVRSLKERPADQPFTLHLGHVGAVNRFARLEPRQRDWVEHLLPGPYTLILPAEPTAPPSAVHQGKVGIRVPAHPFFQAVVARLDLPMFGTSVNRHSEPPLNDIEEIIDRFHPVDLILVGPVGLTSSVIIDLTRLPPRLVRGGRLPDDLLR